MRPLLFAALIGFTVAARADSNVAPAPSKNDKRYEVASEAGLAAALKAAVGMSSRDRDRDPDPCVERLKGDFARVILVATFSDDYGCYPYGYFADGVYVDSRTNAGKALATTAFAADPQKRADLALQWTNVALGQTPLTAGVGDDAPRATLQKDGSVFVEGWQDLPSKPTLHRARKIRAVFSVAGDIKIEILKTKNELLK